VVIVSNLSLYTANPYTTASTAYSATSEVSSSGGSQYTAGGNLLASQVVSNVNNVATVDFADSVWGSPTPATFTAAFGAIYNSTSSNKLVVVLDFGGNKTCSRMELLQLHFQTLQVVHLLVQMQLLV
jgi:hypothetical protein